MRKKILFAPLWGIFALSLLSSCRTEDGAIQQKQIEDNRFSTFVPKSGKTINYADGFAYLMKRYDNLHKTNLSGINNKPVIGTLASNDKSASVFQNGESYVESNIRSQTVTEQDDIKWVAFPKVKENKVVSLVVGILSEKGTRVTYRTFGNDDDLYKQNIILFQAALDRRLKRTSKLALNASLNPIALADPEGCSDPYSVNYDPRCKDIEEVIINIPKPLHKEPNPGYTPPPIFPDPVFPTDPDGKCGDYGDCSGSSGNGNGGGDSAPSEEQVKDQIKDQPFALVDAPCDVVKKWLATAKHTVAPVQVNKLKSIVETVYNNSSVTLGGMTYERIASVQRIDDAYSAVVNMDYFPVTVDQLPIVNGTRLTPEQFLNYIRTDINNFVDTRYSKFTPYNNYGIDDRALWNSNNPLGSVIKIEIPGDPGSVMVTGYNSDKWTFTTVYEPVYQTHPVSGNRDFGFTRNTNGSYTFYTRGVDRLTKMEGTALHNVSMFFTGSSYPLGQADKLWKSFQEKISYFVNHHSGSASVVKEEIERPDWQKVKDVINGKLPLSTLSKDCKN